MSEEEREMRVGRRRVRRRGEVKKGRRERAARSRREVRVEVWKGDKGGVEVRDEWEGGREGDS